MKPSRAAFRCLPSLPGWVAVVVGLTLSLAIPAQAETFADLFTVSVAPDPAAGNQRADAERRGMRVLLTRITGRRETPDDPRLAGLIARAGQLVDSYSPVAQDEIRIGYLRGPVTDELTRLGLPLWGDERPSTLLWLAVDFGTGQRAELGAAADRSQVTGGPVDGVASEPLPNDLQSAFTAIADTVLLRADERGLPLSLPRLDDEDRRLVRFADVWGGFDPLIALAAERYGVDTVLIAQVSVTPEGPQTHWILRRGDVRQEFQTATPADGIEQLADQLAAEYTIVGGLRETRIRVRGISSWADYGRVMQYLNELSIIDRVDVESLSPEGELVLRLIARGEDRELRQVLTLRVLTLPESGLPGPPGPTPDSLVFVPAWRAAELAPDVP